MLSNTSNTDALKLVLNFMPHPLPVQEEGFMTFNGDNYTFELGVEFDFVCFSF